MAAWIGRGRASRTAIRSRSTTTRTANCAALRELFDKNGFSDITYRKDGTKWYGRQRNPGEDGRGTSLYFASNGTNLKRTFKGTEMTVVVLDNAGKELYTQVWISGIKGYLLQKVTEPTGMGAFRVIHVQENNVTSVDYHKANGTLDSTEQPNALSTPVDAGRLRELSDEDPTRPILRQLR